MTTILDMDALRAAKDAYQDAAGNFPGTDRLVRSIITAYLSAIATPSTGAVGWKPVAYVAFLDSMADDFERKAIEAKRAGLTQSSLISNAVQCRELSRILAAAPPSSPSERDDALEEAATIAEAEQMTGIPPIGLWSQRDIEIAVTTCLMTAKSIASAIRVLKASRSDTVGPEAGE
jgi:hypothetical protein